MASCVRWKGHIYGFDEKTLRCLDAKTGEVVWSERGLGKGALAMAEGKLIVLSDRGELLIAEATPKQFKAVKRQNVLSARNVWTMPVLSNGRIYCRSSSGELVCLTISR